MGAVVSRSMLDRTDTTDEPRQDIVEVVCAGKIVKRDGVGYNFKRPRKACTRAKASHPNAARIPRTNRMQNA